MRARNIKPGFFQNDDLAELPYEGRLLFIGLWCIADREGRLEDKPKWIKGMIFPYDDLTVNSPLDNGDVTVKGLLEALEHKGFIRRYSVDGRPLIAISNFKKHQSPHHTEKQSELPPPEQAPNTPKKENQPDFSGPEVVVEIPKSVSNSDPLKTLTVNSPLDNEKKASRAQYTRACVPDSLIPDSLIPDSGFTDSTTSCSEPSDEAPEPEASADCFLTIPTNKNGIEYPVTESQIVEFNACYPAVEVRQQIREMRAWSMTHPQQRKTYGGMPRFINGWLSREQDKGAHKTTPRDPPSTVLTRQGQQNYRVAQAYLERMGPTCKTE